MNIQTVNVFRYENDIPRLPALDNTHYEMPNYAGHTHTTHYETHIHNYEIAVWRFLLAARPGHTYITHYEIALHNDEMTHPCFFWRLGLDTHTL